MFSVRFDYPEIMHTKYFLFILHHSFSVLFFYFLNPTLILALILRLLIPSVMHIVHHTHCDHIVQNKGGTKPIQCLCMLML